MVVHTFQQGSVRRAVADSEALQDGHGDFWRNRHIAGFPFTDSEMYQRTDRNDASEMAFRERSKEKGSITARRAAALYADYA